MQSLWLSGGRFPEWIAADVRTLRDCQMYGCTPSELDDQPAWMVVRHRAILAAESEYIKADSESNARAAARRRGR